VKRIEKAEVDSLRNIGLFWVIRELYVLFALFSSFLGCVLLIDII